MCQVHPLSLMCSSLFTLKKFLSAALLQAEPCLCLSLLKILHVCLCQKLHSASCPHAHCSYYRSHLCTNYVHKEECWKEISECEVFLFHPQLSLSCSKDQFFSLTLNCVILLCKALPSSLGTSVDWKRDQEVDREINSLESSFC